MSAADRMAVRMPGGEIRSVPRRVGLAMIAQSRATHERAGQPVSARKARKSTARPIAAQSAAHGAVTVVTAESPELKSVQVDVTPVHVVIEEVAPDGSRETVVDSDSSKILGGAKPDAVVVDEDPTALPIDAPAVEQPKGNAGRSAWSEYAGVVGVEVTDEMGRNEIRDAVVAKLESDRMSQPAFAEFEGGRLATPEDEPVTESAVTHADPGERTA